MGDSLAPEIVEPLLRGRFGRPYVYRDTCESTQRLLGPGYPEGSVAVCDVQTAGRGRSGRAWKAPRGAAILCSVLLRPPAERRISQLALVGGLAGAEAIEHAAGERATIKWPNDVLVGGRKIVGVLAEASGEAVVLGVGINVRQADSELPRGTKVPAGSLASHTGVRRAELLAELLARLEAAYDLWRESGLEPLHGRLVSRDALSGVRVVVGGQTGVAAGIDQFGRLVIEFPTGSRAIESGEVAYAR